MKPIVYYNGTHVMSRSISKISGSNINESKFMESQKWENDIKENLLSIEDSFNFNEQLDLEDPIILEILNLFEKYKRPENYELNTDGIFTRRG